jgi:uncharacterized SAM-binding protein YcdF (DUF218 family)
MTARRWRLAAVIVFAAILCAAAAALLFSGAILVNAEAPQKADIVVVIGGDYKGNRIMKGAELVRQGFAPEVLSSGSGDMYGSFESDLAIAYAVSHGYPRSDFISLQYPALSTADEARAVIARLRRMGVHKYLLVTSDYHTGRAGRVFRREGRDLEVHTIAAPDPNWNNGRWWSTREGRKLWLNEMMKTVADRFGI